MSSFRLAPTTRALLADLSDKTRLSQAALIERAVLAYYLDWDKKRLEDEEADREDEDQDQEDDAEA